MFLVDTKESGRRSGVVGFTPESVKETTRSSVHWSRIAGFQLARVEETGRWQYGEAGLHAVN